MLLENGTRGRATWLPGFVFFLRASNLLASLNLLEAQPFTRPVERTKMIPSIAKRTGAGAAVDVHELDFQQIQGGQQIGILNLCTSGKRNSWLSDLIAGLTASPPDTASGK